MDVFDAIRSEVAKCLEGCDNLQNLQAIKTQFLGPKSLLMHQVKLLKTLDATERAQLGRDINTIKSYLETIIAEKMQALQTQERMKKLGFPIDPSLPSPYPEMPPLHPLTQVHRHVLNIFKQLGYSVIEGAEIETDWACFDALNVPLHHPARAPQDTFFLSNVLVATTVKKNKEAYLLRTQTSTVQIRALLQHQPPLKIVSAGRVFRRDTVDATHNFNFHQIEGLSVDKSISIADLKGTLDFFVQKFFGKKFKIRLRPSFFPFTEPSFEMDIFVTRLGKFRNTWIEVLGCGMVNPNVFKNAGLNDDWQGFAFGFGIERLAMLLYDIEDIRQFYQNDERFLKQF